MDVGNQDLSVVTNDDTGLVRLAWTDPSPGPGDWPFTSILTDKLAVDSGDSSPQHLDFHLQTHHEEGPVNGPTPCSFRSLLLTAIALVVSKHAAQDNIALDIGFRPEYLRSAALLGYQPLFLKVAEDVPFEVLRDSIGDALPRLQDDLQCHIVSSATDEDPQASAKPNAATNIAVCFSDASDLRTVPNCDHDIAILVHQEESGRAHLQIRFDERLHHQISIQRFADHIGNVLDAAVEDPDMLLRDISLADLAEIRHLLEDRHRTRDDFSLDKTIAELFARNALSSPDAVAVEGSDRFLSYGQLDRESNQLARLLDELGVGSQDVVPVLHSRNADFLVAALAVWKAGGALLPVDPKYPPDRIATMIDFVQASVVVTQKALITNAAFSMPSATTLTLVSTDRMRAESASDNQSVTHYGRQDWEDKKSATFTKARSPTDPAYVVFTSGSTGIPKGVVIRHEGAINHIFAEAADLSLGPDIRFLQTAQLSTDLCVWQFLAPALLGGTIVVCRFEDIIDGSRLFQTLRTTRSTVVELVPVVLSVLLKHICSLDTADRALPSLKWMIVTGESVPVQLLNQWLSVFPEIPIVNAYGPSEVSDDTAQQIFTSPLSPTTKTVPVGQPLINLRVLILDRSGRLVPTGVPGEICVSGVGVASGYWADTPATERCFVPNPYPGKPGELMYKTGDLGRWLHDGNIELLGRADDQIKIRGFRIELGEIEAVLQQHDSVEQCVAMVRDDAFGNKRLVAYLITRTPVTPVVLREFLLRKLPEYMVPSAYVLMDEFPLTANGVKVNRRALPAPNHDAVDTETESRPPQTGVEKKLAAAWCELLGLEHVGIDDNFFALGGDSMQTVEMVVAAEAHGVHLDTTAVFEHPTIAALAEIAEKPLQQPAVPVDYAVTPPFELDDLTRAKLTKTYGKLDSIYPLSPTQLGIYLAYLTSKKDIGLYVEQINGLISDSHFDTEAFREAWLLVTEHHPSLRAIFIRRGLKTPLQAVQADPQIEFSVQDESSLSPELQADLIAEHTDREICYRLQLDRNPLMRIAVLKLGPDRYHFTWTYPHILMDGWSESFVLTQVLEAYDQIRSGKSPQLDESRHYFQYIEWLNKKDLTEAETFWRSMLQGFREPTPLPFSSLPESPDKRQSGFGKIESKFVRTSSTRLQEVAREHGWTVNTILQGAWSLLLAGSSGRSDVLFGVAASGRQVPFEGIENVVGLLVNSVPFRSKVDQSAPVDNWLTDVQRDQFESRRHEYAPLAKIVEWSDCPCRRDSLFSSYFVMANYPDQISAERTADGPTLSDLDFHTLPEYPLTVFVQPGAEYLIRFMYDRQYYADDDVCRLLSCYQAIIEEILRNPLQKISDTLAMSAAAESPDRIVSSS